MPSIVGLLTLSACLTAFAAEPALRTHPVEAYALLGLGTREGGVDLSFSPDGRTLLSTCREDPVLWEVASARQRAEATRRPSSPTR